MILMADCDSNPVSSIHKLLAELHFKDFFQHIGHLLFGSAAAAGYRLFHFFGEYSTIGMFRDNAAAIATPCARPSFSMD